MKKGFTLLELIIVVIIIGILVSLAIPKFTGTVEKAKCAEALGVMDALKGAQMRYKAENGSYTSNCLVASTDLDTSYTVPQYFTATGAVCNGVAGTIAMTRQDDGYTLTLNIDTNVISCAPGTSTSITCAAAGY